MKYAITPLAVAAASVAFTATVIAGIIARARRRRTAEKSAADLTALFRSHDAVTQLRTARRLETAAPDDEWLTVIKNKTDSRLSRAGQTAARPLPAKPQRLVWEIVEPASF